MSHSQKGKALVCGLSTRKMRTPLVDPETEDAEQRVPQGAPVAALEIQRIDVLVLLGRILGVLDGSVGALFKPLRMLGDLGMIGRTLEGDVERELDSLARRALDKAAKIGERAELRMNGGVAAFFRTDGPGTAGIAGLRRLAELFFPLRKLSPMGWMGGR